MINLIVFWPPLPWGCFTLAFILALFFKSLFRSPFCRSVLTMVFLVLGSLLALIQGWTLSQLLTPLLAVTAACLFSLGCEEGGHAP